MANSTANLASTSTPSPPAGGTALRGRIEAIGVFDLTRIAITNGSTGRLLVFNDQFDAELYYVDGRLVSVVSSGGPPAESLGLALKMTDGEFEFAAGLEPPLDQRDDSLHGALTQAIKNHYQKRVRSRQDSAADPTTQVRHSGVHRVGSEPTIAVAPIVTIEAPGQSGQSTVPALTRTTTQTMDSEQLCAGEFGRAVADAAGRATVRIGSVSSQETALVSLASKLAQTLASTLGMRDLQRFEIISADHKALLCGVSKDGIRISSIDTDTADVDSIWRELGT